MRLHEVKGADLLPEAADSLSPNCTIVIAGDGHLRPFIERSAAFRSGRIRLLGNCSEGRIVDLLAAADAFLLASRNDPYPLSVIEDSAAARQLGADPHATHGYGAIAGELRTHPMSTAIALGRFGRVAPAVSRRGL